MNPVFALFTIFPKPGDETLYRGMVCTIMQVDYRPGGASPSIDVVLQGPDGKHYEERWEGSWNQLGAQPPRRPPAWRHKLSCAPSGSGACVFYGGIRCEIRGIEWEGGDRFGPNTLLLLRDNDGKTYRNIRLADVTLFAPSVPPIPLLWLAFPCTRDRVLHRGMICTIADVKLIAAVNSAWPSVKVTLRYSYPSDKLETLQWDGPWPSDWGSPSCGGKEADVPRITGYTEQYGSSLGWGMRHISEH